MIDVAGFTKYYNGKPVLKNFSVHVSTGETVVVIGKSGCGKTTLLKHIAKLEDDSTGDILGKIVLFDAIDITRLTESELRKIQFRGKLVGYVFQNNALFDFMTVRENISLPLEENEKLSKDELDKRVKSACSKAELEVTDDFLNRKVDRLSGGEKKRVALARTLALFPKIILLDEPTANLDPPTATEIALLINRLRRKNEVTSIVTTHDMKIARIIASRIVMVKDGEKIFDGTIEEADKNEQIRSFMEGF